VSGGRRLRRRLGFAAAVLLVVLVGVLFAPRVHSYDFCRHCGARRTTDAVLGVHLRTTIDGTKPSTWCDATFGPCPAHAWLTGDIMTDNSLGLVTSRACNGPGIDAMEALQELSYAVDLDLHVDVTALRSRLERASDADVAQVARQIKTELRDSQRHAASTPATAR
jgi:hypothetical protein